MDVWIGDQIVVYKKNIGGFVCGLLCVFEWMCMVVKVFEMVFYCIIKWQVGIVSLLDMVIGECIYLEVFGKDNVVVYEMLFG